MIERRAFLSGAAALATFPAFAGRVLALPKMVVHKDPSCGCCGAWIDHVRAAGFAVEVREDTSLDRLKERLGVTAALASCHTAEIDGYVVEGHVPAAEILRLLAERPAARGLAAPGMPVGSPGMEVASAAPETYAVVLFGGASGDKVFARYRGVQRL